MQQRRHATTSTDVGPGVEAAANRAADMKSWYSMNGIAPDQAALQAEQVQARLARIGRDCPTVRTAWAMLDQQRIHPVPLDGNLEPAGDPLDTVDALLDHYEANPGHGVGVTTGPHPLRDWSYVAVAVDSFAAWREWKREASTVVAKVRNLGGFADDGNQVEVGEPVEKSHMRDPGGVTKLAWSPPPLPNMKLWPTNALGGPLTAELEKRKAGRGGWIWLVIPGDVTVGKARKVAPGITTLPTGTVIPWEGSRTTDGWQLTLSAPAGSQSGFAPARGGVADWFVAALLK